MDIGTAVMMLKAGRRVARAGWNGRGMYLFLVEGGWSLVYPTGGFADLPADTLPFVAMKTADNRVVPWLCSQTDLLADDWEVVP